MIPSKKYENIEYINYHLWAPTEERNADFIFLSYTVKDYFSQRSTTDRFEIVLREYFKHYFLESEFYLTLTPEEELYIIKTYWIDFFEGIFLIIKKYINSIVDPIIKEYSDLWEHLKNPPEIIPFDTSFAELFLDGLIYYTSLDISNYNLCAGVTLASYYRMAELDNGYFLRVANLFNDFAFFNEYYYNAVFRYSSVDYLSSSRDYDDISKVIIPFDFTVKNIIKYIGISIWEYYFPPKIEYRNYLYSVIGPEIITFISEIISREGVSLQEFLTMSYIDSGTNYYYKKIQYLEDYEDLYSLYRYDKAMEKKVLKFYKFKNWVISYPYFTQSIYYYFTYKYIRFLLAEVKINDMIVGLGLYEHLFILLPMQRAMKDDKDPIHHSKPAVLNFLRVKLSQKQALVYFLGKWGFYFYFIKYFHYIILYLSLKHLKPYRTFRYIDEIFSTFIVFIKYFYEKDYFFSFCGKIFNFFEDKVYFIGFKFNLIKRTEKKSNYIVKEGTIPIRYIGYYVVKMDLKFEGNIITTTYTLVDRDKIETFYILRKSNYIVNYSKEEKKLPNTPKRFNTKYFKYIIPLKVLEKRNQTREEYIKLIHKDMARHDKIKRKRRAKIALAYGKYNEKEFGDHDEQSAYDDIHAFVMLQKVKEKKVEIYNKKMKEKGQREEREKIEKYLSLAKEFLRNLFKK